MLGPMTGDRWQHWRRKAWGKVVLVEVKVVVVEIEALVVMEMVENGGISGDCKSDGGGDGEVRRGWCWR